MDPGANSEAPPTHATVGGAEVPRRPLLSSGFPCEADIGGTVLLQLLEFKTHLLEAVEELHIRRDAETRFEAQISKVVLEKQELQWEKESLQNQIETAAKQHTESVSVVKKQLQAKIRNIEEEKGKYQVIAELKDKEIGSLKEELKLLQLLKYNLEKRSSELEQKLALQSRSKDSHLNQMGEVERRFSALTRQCAVVKQAHHKLQQNVDEAMEINQRLASDSEKQEASIQSLKKELEEASKQLIRAKMSSVQHDRSRSPTRAEQRLQQQLQQLQHKLGKEAEMNKRLSDENAALRAGKQEVMKSLLHNQQLMLSQTQTLCTTEAELQTRGEQHQALRQEHEVMREKSKAMEDKVAQLMESYAASKTMWDKEKSEFLDRIRREQQNLQALREAHEELQQKHAQLSAQAVQMRDCRGSLGVSAQRSPTSVQGTGGVRPPREPGCSSALPIFGSLQNSAASQAANPDCLKDARAVTGGQEAPNHHQPPQWVEPCSTASGDELASKGSSVVNESADSLTNERQSDEENEAAGGMDNVRQDDNGEEEGRTQKQQTNREKVQGEDVEEGGEKRGTPSPQITDNGVDRQGDMGRGVGKPTTETKDRAGRESRDGEEARGKAETEIQAQTGDKASDALRVVDFTVSSETAASQGGLARTDADSDSRHARAACRRHALSRDERPGGGHTSSPAARELRQDELQTNQESPDWLPSAGHQVYEANARVEENIAAQLSQTSNVRSSQGGAAGSGGDGSVRDPARTDAANSTSRGDEMCDTDPGEDPTGVMAESDKREQAGGRATSLQSDCDGHEGSNDQTDVRDSRGTEQEGAGKSKLKDARVDAPLDEDEHRTQVEMSKQEDAGGPRTRESETELKPPVHPSTSEDHQQPLEKEVPPDDIDDLPSPGNKTHTPSFDWRGVKRRTAGSTAAGPTAAGPTAAGSTAAGSTAAGPTAAGSTAAGSTATSSVLHQFVQRSTVCQQSASGSLGHPLSTALLMSKHNKVPLVISRASELLNASSVSGAAARSRRHQQGEWKATGETRGEPAADVTYRSCRQDSWKVCR